MPNDFNLKGFGIMFVSGIPYITDCVVAELEKLGAKYQVARR